MVFFIPGLKEKRPSTAITFTEPSRTKQCFKDDADINYIVKKFGLDKCFNKDGTINTSGIPDEFFACMRDAGINDVSQYSSIMDGKTYHDVLNSIASVNSSFEYLPSAIRDKFKNNPSLFLDYLRDPANLPEMQKLGLVIKSNKTPDSTTNDESSPKPDSNVESK